MSNATHAPICLPDSDPALPLLAATAAQTNLCLGGASNGRGTSKRKRFSRTTTKPDYGVFDLDKFWGHVLSGPSATGGARSVGGSDGAARIA